MIFKKLNYDKSLDDMGFDMPAEESANYFVSEDGVFLVELSQEELEGVLEIAGFNIPVLVASPQLMMYETLKRLSKGESLNENQKHRV